MGLVDIKEGVGPVPFDFGKPPDVGAVAVHAVDAFHHNQHAVMGRGLLSENLFEMVQVVVAEAGEGGFGEGDAVDNACVDQTVGHDERPARGESLHHAGVGVVAAVE